MAPAPNLEHQRIVRRLAFAIQKHVEKNGGGELFLAPVDVYFSEANVFQPDLVFVSDSGLAKVEKDGLYGAPDLVIEVLSPGSYRHDLGQKKAVYLESGVIEYLVIDPGDQSITRHGPAGRVKASTGVETVLSSQVLSGLLIPFSEIFTSR